MYDELEPVARLRIGKAIDASAAQRQSKMVAVGADFARRGLSRSGPFEAAKIKLLIDSVGEICREIANTWRDLIVRRDGRLIQSSAGFIMQRVEEFAHAQSRNIPSAMQTESGVVPPDWAKNQAAQGIDAIVSGIRRDLEIEWREHDLFPAITPISSNEVFVIMAADSQLEPLYSRAFEPAIRGNHLNPYLMVEREPTASITNEIVSRIETARLILADLTFERPNCYYEVGYAQAKGKKVIFTAREDHDPRRTNRQPNDPKVHFDLDSHRISFWTTKDLLSLQVELTERFREAMRSLEVSATISARVGETGETEILNYFRNIQAARPGPVVLYDHLVSQGLGWPLDEVQLVLKHLVEKGWLQPFAGGFSLTERSVRL